MIKWVCSGDLRPREMQTVINPSTALAVAAALFITFANAQEKLPNGPGRETMKRVCGACHSAENVAGMAKTREEWGAVVGEMAAAGAQGTEDEFNEIVDYLGHLLSENFEDQHE